MSCKNNFLNTIALHLNKSYRIFFTFAQKKENVEISQILGLFENDQRVKQIEEALAIPNSRLFLKGLSGSLKSVFPASLHTHGPHLIILNDREEAAYLYNDLSQLCGSKHVSFLPSSYKRSPEYGQKDSQNVLLRTEALSQLHSNNKQLFVITYPEALIEKVLSADSLDENRLIINNGDQLDISFITDVLNEYHFQRVDFVFEPGQYSVRGSIIDVYSFSDEDPYRIDFFGDEVDSIRKFNLENQLSKEKLEQVTIVPNLTENQDTQSLTPLSDYLPPKAKIWVDSFDFIEQRMDAINEKIEAHTFEIDEEEDDDKNYSFLSDEAICNFKAFFTGCQKFPLISTGNNSLLPDAHTIEVNASPQPVFHKNFELLEENLKEKQMEEYQCFILSDNPKQFERLKAIFHDRGIKLNYGEINHSLHEGVIDHDAKLCLYTDHQIFERYHKFSLRTEKAKSAQQAISLKELNRLNPGDFVVHIDHGVGRFGGLVTQSVNGKPQEAIRLVYRDNDVLLVNIHSLHRISKFKGKEGTPPKINKLGTAAWKNLKEKTKKKVKDIARELIALYAQRKTEPGFTYSPDTYLQTELEASFFFEDTPDQTKATVAVKGDMEKPTPMDRLVCGDVGFGKTEIAIRAAFKAIADNKQVAVLVPTTILALQHYQTFKERLKDFPANIEYVSRLRRPKDTKAALTKLKEGQVDILIGTHRLTGKDVEFKDLGLLIIDEEQRFGVAIKEKLKQLKVNVDTLTLTATPIPRTLQFSLMGARDLSILNTAPPNRHPIITELHVMNEEIIKEAILYEVERGGQVFFINNRVQNIMEVQDMVNRILPEVKTIVAHGQMEGPKLEKIMLDFIEGDYDVLIATTIIESGLDIPNANTIIINNAHNFGLSELHQLRGRVGRSNKKAFCYLMAPPLSTLTQEARRRLKIVEEFSDLGSGFNIAMQDLDIRGAGDVLGGEQSGFISDIGYETYQRILNEALLELRETEYKDTFEDQQNDTPSVFVTDCVIETDTELRLPDSYIENVAERMHLYRELDNMEEEEQIVAFENNLIDRFGPIPESGQRLFELVRIRRMAKQLGIEKIIFKNNLLYFYFVSNQESPFYQSSIFSGILMWIQNNSKKATMKEGKSKLYLVMRDIKTINEVKELVSNMNDTVNS
ncbi:transcription-repair coupling factor [Carboxylicivirga marina]|uniref:transcription-repair coupling factor n=1 Tax=Carboxylicivirga marina TaxID=2800988 RepID=UPI001F2D56C5|nr:transcription-repair coupling factor [Carboxylicivirga marina]